MVAALPQKNNPEEFMMNNNKQNYTQKQNNSQQSQNQNSNQNQNKNCR